MLSVLNILADGGANWGNFWEPPQGSTVAPEVDALFYGILWTCIFFFVLITVLLVVFSIKYRHREGYTPPPGPKHNTALELTWTFVPTVIVTIIFVYGFQRFMDMEVPPPFPYEIDVTAHMWSYNFTYPNQHLDDTLHVPINTPIQLVLNSVDVIHGFYIPVFRVKHDAVPGRYNKIWFEATTLGEFDIFCTQYCGQGHSTMRSHVFVQSLDDYKKWLADASVFKGTAEQYGEMLYKTRGCNQCHTTDGSSSRCPTWKDVYGSTITFQDGTSEVADENYLHLVITKPNSKLIPGFQPIMPATIDAGLLTEKEVPNLIAYIKTLSVHYKPSGNLPMTAPATQPAGK